MKQFPLGSLSLLASLPLLHATPLGLESFPLDGPGYLAGSGNLVGQERLADGFTGPWLEAYSGSQSPNVETSGLSFKGVPSNGGSVSFHGSGNGRAGRLLANSYDDSTDGESIYFSVLMQLGSVTNSYRAFELHQGGFDDGANRKLQIATGESGLSDAGIITGAENFAVRLFNSNTVSLAGDLGVGDFNVNLFVVRIDFSSTVNTDVVTVWRNPSDLADEAKSASDYTATGFDLQIDRATLARFGSDGLTFDEIRLGSEWVDVTTGDSFDTDSDGIRDAWENANGLNVGIDDSGDDTDTIGGADGLTNLEEFLAGTNPQLADSDDDGLIDGVEDMTEIYADTSSTGTDPLDDDSDGDSIKDGLENNRGTYLSDTDPGTDPNKLDTDGDGASDGDELAAGSDPTDISDTPESGNPEMVGLEFFDYLNAPIAGANGGEGFDYSNTDGGFVGHTQTSGAWTATSGAPTVDCGTLRTANSGAARTLNGPGAADVTAGTFSDEASNDVVYAKVNLTRRRGVSWSGLSFLDDGAEVVRVGVVSEISPSVGVRTFGINDLTSGGAIFFSQNDKAPSATGGNIIVAKLNTSTREISLFVDPDLAQAEGQATVETKATLTGVGVYGVTGIRLASGGMGESIWDDLAVTTSWEELANSGLDADGDDLRDSWETAFSVTDATGNADSDGLTNLEEQAFGTNPMVADSDGDNLSDGVEVATHGTNPCFTDSDGDGSTDDVELANMTNPNDPADGETFIVDGSRELSYGAAVSVQTIETGFGDNQSEWNAAYAHVENEKLYLFFSGNLEDNFNKLEVFLDAGDGVTSNVFASAGNDGSASMNGMTFDAAFTPDYHVILRRGSSKFDADFSDLASQKFSSYLDVFGGNDAGSGFLNVGTSTQNTFAVLPEEMLLAYDGSNTAGIGGATGAPADQTAAQDVKTGIELCIPLVNLGISAGSIKVMLLQNNGGHDYLSNQSLGGLPAGVGNLEGPGGVDFSTFEGEQFFEVELAPREIVITRAEFTRGDMIMNISGLVTGNPYYVERSNGGSDFNFFQSIEGTFLAESESQQIIISSPAPTQYFRIVSGNAPSE